MRKKAILVTLALIAVALVAAKFFVPSYETSLRQAHEFKLRQNLLTMRADPKQTITGYPPAVYMKFFLACPGGRPCTRTEDFRVDPVPKGCCMLTITNGDGRGTDEVRSYEVFLNAQRVLLHGQARNAQAAVKILQDNTLKVVLIGEPHSKVFILIAYNPRESK
jgi:hypothetical protein